MMIRHLVMPNNVGGTKEVIEWAAENLPKDTDFNLMSQYTPIYKAFDHHEISRRITRKEYAEAVNWAQKRRGPNKSGYSRISFLKKEFAVIIIINGHEGPDLASGYRKDTITIKKFWSSGVRSLNGYTWFTTLLIYFAFHRATSRFK